MFVKVQTGSFLCTAVKYSTDSKCLALQTITSTTFTSLDKSLLLHILQLTNYKSIKETVSPQLTAKENLPPQNKAHDA
jgi:hypothetical protein